MKQIKIKDWNIFIPENYAIAQFEQEFIQIIERYNLENNTSKNSFFYRTLQGIPFYWNVLQSKKEILLSSTLCSQEVDFKLNWTTDLEQSIGIDNVFNLENQKISENFISLTKNLQKQINQYRPNFWEKLTDFGLLLTAQYDLLRIHLLKFLAILPSLNHDNKGHKIKKIWLETLDAILQDKNSSIPSYLFCTFKILRPISKHLVPASFFTTPLRFLVKKMATRFVATDNMKDVFGTLNELYKTKRAATIDQLGELVVSEDEAQHYCDQVISIIEQFKNWEHYGAYNQANIPYCHVSLKVTALCARLNPDDLSYGMSRIFPRLQKILLKAQENKVFVQIDAEHFTVRDCVFEIYKEVLLDTPKLKDYKDTGIVVQAYLKDSYEHWKKVLNLAKERNLTMPIRLVKGAYWDSETINAKANGQDAPQFLSKKETDGNFRFLAEKTLESSPHLQLCLASHNIIDHTYIEDVKSAKYPKSLTIEHQCLHMTYEALSIGLAKLNYPVRNYVPLGDLLVGMAYLVRRIMENSSQVGFLSQMRKSKNANILDFKHQYLDISSKLKQINMDTGFIPVSSLRLHLDFEKSAY